jgi:polar amino acid transport system substrate-binding protein
MKIVSIVFSIVRLREEMGRKITGSNGFGVSMLKLFSFLLVLCLVTACATPAAPRVSPASKDKLGEIQGRGRLVVATDPSYPPQSELIEGAERLKETRCRSTEYTASELRGFDIDVAIDFSRRLGVEPCFVTPVWTQIVAGNWADRWDISIGSMAITQDRMSGLFFTQPYVGGAAVVFVHQSNQTTAKLEDLSGKKIGVCAGCAYEEYLGGTLEVPGKLVDFRIKNAAVIGYDTDTSALEDLALGDGKVLDAVMTDPDTGRIAIEKGLPIRQLDEAAYYDYVAGAIDKKSSKDPLSFVRQAIEIIQQMHQDGTLRKLSIQYYGSDFAKAAEVYNIDNLEQLP